MTTTEDVRVAALSYTALLSEAEFDRWLAERDRKNRFEAWWEGAEDERLNGSPINPYVEKEQGNGN